jgi:hypothetical protein
MVEPADFSEITPSAPSAGHSAAHVVARIPIPKTARVTLFSSGEWEEFVEEWASSLKSQYKFVKRFSGSGDKGIDVAGFSVDATFAGGWDNYQCKHYGPPLRPSDIWIEIGKIVYYTYLGEYTAPDHYYFVAPKGLGTALTKLLSNVAALKSEFFAHWNDHCREGLGTVSVPLTGGLLAHAQAFDYGIFGSVSIVSLIEQHARTPFHAVRFGGGLPPRTAMAPPPAEIQSIESRYIQQLYGVYSEAAGKPLTPADLGGHPQYQQDFLRQRERFYSAESLRNFARDNVPPGTFESLKDETYHAVIDTCEKTHASGLDRMRETLTQAGQTSFPANPLFSVVHVPDKQGICHQLANEDRLIWMKTP